MKINIVDLELHHFTQLEQFSDRYFDQRYDDRYTKLIKRFLNDRANLKVACLVGYLSSIEHNTKHLVITSLVDIGNGGKQSGYEIIRFDDNEIAIHESVVDNIIGVADDCVFNRIKAYVVDQQGFVDNVVNVEQVLCTKG